MVHHLTREGSLVGLVSCLVLLVAGGSAVDAQDRAELPKSNAPQLWVRRTELKRYTLLQNINVIAKLGLTREQSVAIRQTVLKAAKVTGDYYQRRRELRQLPPAEAASKREELRNERDKRMTELFQPVIDAFDAAQRKRFEQAFLRKKGTVALTEQPVIDAVKLSEKQLEAIRKVLAEEDRLIQALVKKANAQKMDLPEMLDQAAVIQDRSKAAADEILDDEQRRKFAEMKGEQVSDPAKPTSKNEESASASTCGSQAT